ncbi:AN1-type zinc finger protein 3 homolog [Menidia menidia]
MNLCSKCFADVQKKQPEEDCPPTPLQSGGSSQSSVFESSSSSQASAAEPSSTFSSTRAGVSSTETAQGTLCTPTKRPRESATGVECEASPEKRPRGGDEEEEDEEEEEEQGGAQEARRTPKQKNRRRCFRCQTKLELVQQELGSCRCGYVFCMLHRLPEQHDCLFDHLGRGREEAVLKMVKLDRKVGRSCQRIGEECS